MAALQNQPTDLTDGVGRGQLKYKKYIEYLEGVDRHFLSRCYNAVDSQIYKSQGADRALEARQKMQTYQLALRKLAERVCLLDHKQTPQQKAAIRRTREFLPQEFFVTMGIYGVDIVRGDHVWTFSESQGALQVAETLGERVA